MLVNRPRRLRANEQIRSLVRETQLSVNDLIYPIFLVEGTNIKEEIPTLPNNYHFSVDMLREEIEELIELGIKSVILFGVPNKKDEFGSEAYNENGIVQRGIKEIKKISKEILVVTDVCMCQYTDHGHCGIIEEGMVDNDSTLEYLAKIALSHAKVGADVIAPSDMMDGRVAAIRNILDKNRYHNIPIMSYSAKYASAFYGPFRAAAHSAPQFGDRKTYQMDPCNSDEAIREVELDIMEGADIVIIKPALSYMDIIRRIKDNFNVPIAAYNVSGEYAMIKAAAKAGLVDEKIIVKEMLTSIKRAGADIIITYFAKDLARWILEE
ncbi:porphobilinogen synthase [Paramaledivibacter caminithermalis]|jgi:porphobilinogen synthase|uniref:Delta-aminolevulinic acid dehydratase n=1 Tax=Paramaledivibacter caminithermalis (strain DSM 15212 / CIP 107654 / DViRD3) TaxID=1121301 RepID=A0A1M6MLC1_PARC5|nr:porphobilinogen synthase [Paramaledivibacter caminithermalis]SHJ84073.1 porphobilinogen synthase [Paramaledivibacter caminithermalis DSM 15212]